MQAHLELYRTRSKEEIETELRELASKISRLKRSKDLLRAIKWWRRGYFEDDGVDKFLDYYIVFEMLASIAGYKGKYKKEEWASKFAKDYSITYKIEDVNLARIRNDILHDPGLEKDKAEKLAMLHADRFGIELLNAIKKMIEQGFRPSTKHIQIQN